MVTLKEAVQRDLDRMPEQVRDSALAATALDLADRLGAKDVRPAAASMLHAQLRATLLELARLAPPQAEEDGIDELRARRAQRLA